MAFLRKARRACAAASVAWPGEAVEVNVELTPSFLCARAVPPGS
jgi:hypothetical protein